MTTPLIYDTGALLAAERRKPRVAALHVEALRAGTVPVVPAVVLAQAWRGGSQPELSRFLRGCHIEPDTAEIARAAGVACARAGTSDVVDAIVVVTASARNAVVLTSDPDDLRKLADVMELPLRIRPV
ncbi:MAG TPA: PIN domain-containing protein [Mycobacteriales bacterium]|nr:PIN domain-containing protein [Mycobacteriales bacterium]